MTSIVSHKFNFDMEVVVSYKARKVNSQPHSYLNQKFLVSYCVLKVHILLFVLCSVG